MNGKEHIVRFQTSKYDQFVYNDCLFLQLFYIQGVDLAMLYKVL